MPEFGHHSHGLLLVSANKGRIRMLRFGSSQRCQKWLGVAVATKKDLVANKNLHISFTFPLRNSKS
jgi:hypothetical protein